LERKKDDIPHENLFLFYREWLQLQYKQLLKRNEFDTFFTPKGKPDARHEKHFDQMKEVYLQVLLEKNKRPKRKQKKVKRFKVEWTKQRRSKRTFGDFRSSVNTWSTEPSQIVDWSLLKL